MSALSLSVSALSGAMVSYPGFDVIVNLSSLRRVGGLLCMEMYGQSTMPVQTPNWHGGIT